MCKFAIFLAVGGFGGSVAHRYQSRYGASMYYELDSAFFMNLTVQSEYSDVEQDFLSNSEMNIYSNVHSWWLSLEKGQWPLTQIIPPFSHVGAMTMKNMKLKYQIIDANIVYHEIKSINEFQSKYRLYIVLVFRNYTCFYTFQVQANLMSTLLFAVKINKQINIVKMYDGPHTLCDEINIFQEQAASSTFQVLLIVMDWLCTANYATAVTFIHVNASTSQTFLNSTAESASDVLTCFSSSKTKSHQCSLLLHVQRPFYVNASFSITYIGVKVADCTLGAFAVLITLRQSYKDVLRYCADTLSPQQIVSTKDNLHFVRYSYDVFTKINVSYTYGISKCKGVFINPVLSYKVRDSKLPHGGLAEQIEDSPSYAIELSTCILRRFFDVCLSIRIHAGYCVNIQVSPAYFSIFPDFRLRLHFCLMLNSESSNLKLLHLYTIKSTYFLEDYNDLVSVHLGGDVEKKFATTLYKSQDTFHWKYFVLRFIAQQTPVFECYELGHNRYSDHLYRFTRSNASVVISHQLLPFHHHKYLKVLQKLRTIPIAFNNSNAVAVPKKLLQFHTLSISTGHHPLHVDNSSFVIIKIMSDLFERECANCFHEWMRHSGKIDSSVTLMLKASLTYFTRRKQLLISIPGAVTAQNISVEVSGKSRLSLFFNTKAINIVHLKPLRSAVRDPSVYKEDIPLKTGFVQKTEDGKYVTYRSSATYLSWEDGYHVCINLNSTLPEFHNSVQLVSLLRTLKATSKIPPIRALYVGLKFKVSCSFYWAELPCRILPCCNFSPVLSILPLKVPVFLRGRDLRSSPVHQAAGKISTVSPHHICHVLPEPRENVQSRLSERFASWLLQIIFFTGKYKSISVALWTITGH